MPQLTKLAVAALITFFALASATPTAIVMHSERDIEHPPCFCFDGSPIGFYCGFQEGASPGHLTGDCDPNWAYACGNGHIPMYHLDCPAMGQSCKAGSVNGRGGPGTDFCA